MTDPRDASPASPAREEFSFQADVKQVLDLVIHSLYSHPEIFLRELISNAADAIDRLRFRALTEHDLLGEEQDLEIRIVPNRETHTLTVIDTGIGMTRDELVENLGTVARSGSRRFLEALESQEGSENERLDLIGQFGVGFYSAFLVAERVEVISRAAGATEAWCWSSGATGSFTIEVAPEKTDRGTEVKLFLAEDHRSFLEEVSLRSLVRRYSDFVSHPIKLLVEVPVDKGKGEGESESKGETPETVRRFETVNTASALWRRPRAEITDEQYADFYRHLTHDWEGPLARSHFSVEGMRAYSGLLFIPRHPSFDLFDRGHRRGVRLYVKRVFIMDDCEQMLPEWLRFVRGIIDSDDLPLNVSRELLQEDRIVHAIRRQIIKRTLDLLDEMASERPEDYALFWTHFGAVLKEGFPQDPERKERLAKLVRYASSTQEVTSLADYVERMPGGQQAIYYAIGVDRKALEGGPHIEGLAKKGTEVLFMTDPIDEWVVQTLSEFDGKKLVSVMQGGLNLDAAESEEIKEEREKRSADLRGLSDRFRSVLQETVSEIRISSRLIDSPCCLVVPEGGLHAHTERLLRAYGQELPEAKRILEINPDHPVIERLRLLDEGGDAGADVAEWIKLLYDQALLAEGSPIADPQRFARRVTSLMTQVLSGEASTGAHPVEKEKESRDGAGESESATSG